MKLQEKTGSSTRISALPKVFLIVITLRGKSSARFKLEQARSFGRHTYLYLLTLLCLRQDRAVSFPSTPVLSRFTIESSGQVNKRQRTELNEAQPCLSWPSHGERRKGTAEECATVTAPFPVRSRSVARHTSPWNEIKISFSQPCDGIVSRLGPLTQTVVAFDRENLPDCLYSSFRRAWWG